MASVEEVARQAAAAVDSDANLLLVGEDWVNGRLVEAAARTKFRFLRHLGVFVIPAAVTTGTVTVTRDRDRVVGNAAAKAVWSNALIGRFFQVFGRTTWTQIRDVDPATTDLLLAAPFAEDSMTGTSYRIVQRYARLDPEARKIGPMVYTRLRIPLDIVAAERMQSLAPERQYFSFGPVLFSDAGEDEDGVKRIEAYPYSVKSEQVTYLFWKRPRRYAFQEELPGAIDAAVLREGVLIDVYRYEHAKAVRMGQLEQANAWQAQQRQQEGIWADRQRLLMLQDAGVDDAQFIYGSAQGTGIQLTRDLKTAAEEIWSRGARP